MGRGRLGCVEWSCPENTTKGREGYRSQMAFSRRYRPIHRTPQASAYVTRDGGMTGSKCAGHHGTVPRFVSNRAATVLS